ncbi:Hypothetical protein A7982_03928 [Minicystis rosea]|nr:Hypothetical protein A7982_03928 [Minicystis rosea]
MLLQGRHRALKALLALGALFPDALLQPGALGRYALVGALSGLGLEVLPELGLVLLHPANRRCIDEGLAAAGA